jgi:hypothetical protein
LQLIFANAIKYNGLFLISDTSGVSKLVHDAAQQFGEKLQKLIEEEFSIEVADKIMRAQISHEEELRKKLDMGIEVDINAGRKIKEAVKKPTKLLDYAYGEDIDSDEEKPRFSGILVFYELYVPMVG